MFILAGLLAIGFICDLLIKPVDPKHYMSAEQIAAAAAAGPPADPTGSTAEPRGHHSASGWLIPLAWLLVWVPLGSGIWVTLQKAVLLFK